MRERYGHSVIALMVACGFTVGVIVAVVLGTRGGDDPPTTRRASPTPPVVRTTPTVPRPAPAPDPAPVAARVPSVVGERLDAARERLAEYGVEVEGGGLFGVVVDANWVVVAQSPPAGSEAEPGAPVTLRVERG